MITYLAAAEQPLTWPDVAGLLIFALFILGLAWIFGRYW